MIYSNRCCVTFCSVTVMYVFHVCVGAMARVTCQVSPVLPIKNLVVFSNWWMTDWSSEILIAVFSAKTYKVIECKGVYNYLILIQTRNDKMQLREWCLWKSYDKNWHYSIDVYKWLLAFWQHWHKIWHVDVISATWYITRFFLFVFHLLFIPDANICNICIAWLWARYCVP
jgi:hypothetical protein